MFEYYYKLLLITESYPIVYVKKEVILSSLFKPSGNMEVLKRVALQREFDRLHTCCIRQDHEAVALNASQYFVSL